MPRIVARAFVFGCLVGALFSLEGCSKAPQAVAVSGTIDLDGKPLPEGSITLEGETGTAPDILSVKDGKFEGKATPGKKVVRITADKKGTPTKMGDKVIEATMENYLPPRFNSQSKIQAEVTPSGINPSNFKVSLSDSGPSP